MRLSLAASALMTTLLVLPVAAQRTIKVDPTDPGNLVFRGPDAGFDCASATNFSGSDPCHAALLTDSTTVTAATAGADPHAVHTQSLASFQTSGYRSALTTFPYSPTSAGRQTILDYLAAKAARLTYYDTNHLSQKGGYDGGCANGVPGCWDGWDYFNEFDSVGLAERAYELVNAPDAEGPTPDSDIGGGCSWETSPFNPQDQQESCRTTYAQSFPIVGATLPDVVKGGFWRFYTIHIPAGVTSISATTTSATDIDLYIGNVGYLPASWSYACASYTFSGNEQCQVTNPQAGGWSFGVYGYASTTSSFTIQITQSGAPSANTGQASSITTTGAQLNGTVTPNGMTTTTFFDYGTSPSFGQTATGQQVTGSSPQPVSATIGGLTCNTLYYFEVRATSSAGTDYGGTSTFRTANCPVVFTNDPLIAGTTPVRAIHITELRSAIDAYRQSAGLGAFPYSVPVSAGISVKAVHVTELRTALGEARTAIGLPQLAYAYPALAGQPVRKADIMELRDALR